ncbi:MAG: SGNH/GDSL hydrolase family protein [Acidobacteriota bacterium]
MATEDARTRKIIAAARLQATAVAKQREQVLKRRRKVLNALPEAMMPEAAPADAMALEAVATRGHLIAEGDSWFDYPGVDVIRVLEDELGFDVESVAHAGDRVEMMAFGRDQLTKFSAAIEKVIRRNGTPKGILLSGGGNDVAGQAFGFLLNHFGSPDAGPNESIVRGVIDERCRDAYIHILAAVTQLCREKLSGQVVPILIHGYGRVVPDGRGFLGGAWFLPGPWLEPGFIEKGFSDVAQRQAIMDQIIDRFNAMLADIVTLSAFQHVKYIDLRDVLPNSPNRKLFWANELHPTDRGFRAVAARFAAAL